MRHQTSRLAREFQRLVGFQGTTVPYFRTGRRPGTPFGPDRVPQVAGSLSVVYWVPGPPPGSNPPSIRGLSSPAAPSCPWHEGRARRPSPGAGRPPADRPDRLARRRTGQKLTADRGDVNPSTRNDVLHGRRRDGPVGCCPPAIRLRLPYCGSSSMRELLPAAGRWLPEARVLLLACAPLAPRSPGPRGSPSPRRA
jgi:hypothetical protein